MATKEVGVYRKYHGPVPRDSSGQPLPKSEWPKKRACRWAVRWFGTDGKRYSKSFETRKEAERFAETKQNDVREGKADPCSEILLKDYVREHEELMKGNLAPKTLHLHAVTMRLLAESVGSNRLLHKITTRDIERLRAQRLGTGLSASSANKEVRSLRRIFNLAVLRGATCLRVGIPVSASPCCGLHPSDRPM